MGRDFCYKVKHTYIKVKENNAYAKPKIEKFGFMPMQEVAIDEGGVETHYWAEGWAKTISFTADCPVAKWIKSNIESIYKAETEKEGDSKWLGDILEAGYEFDDQGKLIENEKFLSGLNGQLCIMATGNYHGTLFISLSGAIEFYDARTLDVTCKEEIDKLLAAGVIYEKRLRA